MKRIAPLIISFVFIAVTFLAGCSDGEVDRGEELKEVYQTAKSSLSETFPEDECEYAQVSEFLTNWAESGGVEVEKDAKHYTILRNPTRGGSSKDTTVLQCSVRTDKIRSDLNTLSMGLACLLGPDKHDSIRLIVTEENDGRMIGAEKVPADYLKCSDFINLNGSSDYALYVSGCLTSRATITSSAERTAPKYANAYKIELEFNKYANPYKFNKKDNYPDPINTVGNLLAGCMSSGRLFEIASFDSKGKEGYLPYNVSAVVVIDSNNIEGFQKKFDSSYSTIEKRFDKLDQEFTYTMEETDMPSDVLSGSAASELVSLMYTLNTGICDQDEETGLIYAASYLKSIHSKGKVTVKVDMRTRDTEHIQDLQESYETTSGLCNMKYKDTEVHPVWTSSDDSELADYFSQIVPLPEGESNIMLQACALDIFSAKKPGLNAISYCFVKDSTKSSIKNIINYMDKSRL